MLLVAFQVVGIFDVVAVAVVRIACDVYVEQFFDGHAVIVKGAQCQIFAFRIEALVALPLLVDFVVSDLFGARNRIYNRQNELYIFLKRKVHFFDTFSHENEQLISQLLIFYNRAFSAAFKLVSKLCQSYFNTLSMSFNCYFKSLSMLLKHYAFVLNPMQKC